jgi:hypothetical protein
MHADPHFIGLHRSIKPLSLRGETIHSQVRQMHLAISRHEPLRADEHTTIVNRTLGTKLQKPKDHMQILGQANLRDRIRSRTRYRLCGSYRLVETGKTVTAQHALRKDHQIGPLYLLMVQPIKNPTQIRSRVAEIYMRLNSAYSLD